MTSAPDTAFAKLRGRCEVRVEMAPRVAYRIGGEARFYYTPVGWEDFLEALEVARQLSLPAFCVGSGTNLLVSDRGYEGLILNMAPSEKHDDGLVQIISQEEKSIVIEVPAHFSKAKLLDLSLKNTWAGLEFSAGIPGSMGGAVFMNAGTKWGNYGEVIEEVEMLSLDRGVFRLKKDQLGFKYRGLGEGLLDGMTFVISVRLKLRKNASPLAQMKIVDEIYSYRGLRQPLELPNCGSVFKNPPNSDRGAGRLIEAAGLKGSRVGDAEISLKHANFILNRGHATSADVRSLIRRAQDEVHSRFQVELEPEVIFL